MEVFLVFRCCICLCVPRGLPWYLTSVGFRMKPGGRGGNCHRQHTYELKCLNLGIECARFHVFLGQVILGVIGIPTLIISILNL